MRIAIIIVLALLALLLIPASPAGAQYTQLGLSTDPGGGSCNLMDTAPQLHYVYVLLEGGSGALGVRFRVEQTGGASLIYLEDVPDGLWTSGNVVDGVTICFDGCVGSGEKRVLATVTYLGLGTSPQCSQIEAKPIDPATAIEALSCDGTPHAAYAWPLPINDYSGLCACYVAASEAPPAVTLPANENFCYVVDTEESTWSTIKALYR